MAKQYWVGDYFIDISRNQVKYHDTTDTLPPKALRVLTYLAEHQGRVISYDELLDAVWQDAIVTPNTLQRSIAQLRKVLEKNNDTAVIKTHTKQGYSLECEVNWSSPEEHGEALETNGEQVISPCSSADKNTRRTTNTRWFQRSHGIIFISLALITILLLSVYSVLTQKAPAVAFEELRYLTATDDKEYGARYTPDGQHILFQRYYEKVCINDIWAKDTQTLQEIKLTAEKGTYRGQSLSPDGKTLVFIREHDCDQIPSTPCHTLMKLNFQRALHQPQASTPVLECAHSAIRQPKWLNNQQILLLQQQDDQWQIIVYSVSEDASSVLYRAESGVIHDFVYTNLSDSVTIIRMDAEGKHYHEVIAMDGTLISSHLVQWPANTPKRASVALTYASETNQYIMSSGGLLYQLSRDGTVTPLTIPLSTRVGSPDIHPSGKRLLLISGQYDSDIAKLPLPSRSNLAQPVELSSFERSIAYDDNAKFQPNGQQVALISSRTGTPQIWLSDGERTRMLSDFPKGSFLKGFHWSQTGDAILVLGNYEATIYPLEGTPFVLPFPHAITDVFHWNQEQQTLLANIVHNGVNQLALLNTKEQSFEGLSHKTIKQAHYFDPSTIVLMDNQYQFWLHGGVEDVLIPELNNQGSTAGFVVYKDTLYGINRDNLLWSFHLPSRQHNYLMQLPQGVDAITDTKDNLLLLSFVVAEKKEVIELSTQTAR